MRGAATGVLAVSILLDPVVKQECVSYAEPTRVPNIITEAVAVSLLGFFSGPFFATVSPRLHYHVLILTR